MEPVKVLILNETFNDNSGGGITLSNLFSGWDSDKIAVVCNSFRLEGDVDTSICNTYYQLGYNDYRYIFPFNIIGRKRPSGLKKFDKRDGATVNHEQRSAKSGLRHTLVMKYLFPVLEYLGIMQRMSSINLSAEFNSWLKSFNPDVIYAQAHNVADIKLILLLHAQLKRPLVFHMMDDWPLMVTSGQLLKSKQLRQNDKAMRKLLDQSDLLLSISDGMSEAYKLRYGKNFTAFHNPIDIDFWTKYQRTNYELTNSPALLYAGRVGIGIDESLELIAKSVEQVNNDLDLNMRFVLQTKDRPVWSVNYACVEHRAFVEYQDLPKKFSEADLLILPYDFSPKSIQFIGYSMPTKATEYMISGTPIIIFAPEQTALVKYARMHQWAKVVTDNDINALSQAIVCLINDLNYRKTLAETAINVAQTNHSSQVVTRKFRDTLSSLKMPSKASVYDSSR
jgi:glycosyltransferase involved in cell wall biosynthesis